MRGHAPTVRLTPLIFAAAVRPTGCYLKRGDEWSETFGGNWSKSGRSADEPMVIGAYGSGTERPHVNAASKTAFNSYTPFHDVAMIGLHLEANTRNPDSA